MDSPPQTRSLTAEPVSWSVNDSAESDHLLRRFVKAQGIREEDNPSAFAEQVERARDFFSIVQAVQAQNSGTDPEEIFALVNEALREVRSEKMAQTT